MKDETHIVKVLNYKGRVYTLWAVLELAASTITEEDVIDYYDLFDEDGICINEGDPFYEEPTDKELEFYIEENS